MKFIKQTKFVSSVTLSVLVFVAGFVYPADSFDDFNVEVAKPYTDSLSIYHLTFNLSAETYWQLNDGRLSFQFPESFGLSSVEEVEIQSDHPSRQYRVDRISIDDGNRLVLRLERVDNNGDGGRAGESRVNVEVDITNVRNSAEAGVYRLRGRAYDEDERIAGPSWSERFEIIDFSSEPKAELQIISTELVAPNSPFVNTNQEVAVEVRVANVGNKTAHNVSLGLSSDGESNINSPKTIEILEPNDTAAVSIEVTAATESGTENFTSNILSGNVIEVEAVDDTAGAVIQTPAVLVISASIEQGDTLFVKLGESVTITFEIKNLGEAGVGSANFRLYPKFEEGQIAINEVRSFQVFTPLAENGLCSFLLLSVPIDSNTLRPARMDDRHFVFFVKDLTDTGENLEESFIVDNNPFNPLDGPVTFAYNLIVPSHVELDIFTVSGEKVHSIVFLNGRKGLNKVQWNGRNAEGDMVLNGVYIATLHAYSTGEKATLKLAVLK